MEKKMKKVDYSEYKGLYDEGFKDVLLKSPVDVDLESTRAFLYGYTFTDNYAKCIIPDELSMDYWKEQYEPKFDSDNPFDFDFNAFEEIQREIEIEDMNGTADMYDVDSVQEIRLLEAIDSTGDGATPETALCVIDVYQEYEYLHRVFPYSTLQVKGQELLMGGIDRLEFKDNVYGIECIYFDVRRRFEVGYNRK